MVRKDGKLKSIVVYAKMCRGTMTIYIIENECKHIDQLKNFEFEGFEFHSEDKRQVNCSSRSNNYLANIPRLQVEKHLFVYPPKAIYI